MPVTAPVCARAELICSAKRPGAAVRGIVAEILCDENRSLTFTYRLLANTEELTIPPPGEPRRVEGLWRHTCFEAFLGMKSRPEYYEFNFAPSGEWAAYAFRNYREGGPLDEEDVAPRISLRDVVGGMELMSTIRLEHLPWIKAGTILSLGLSAVIEERDGSRSYWALKNPTAKPDFHHPDCFALEFAVPEQST